jgi:hypothetical protein
MEFKADKNGVVLDVVHVGMSYSVPKNLTIKIYFLHGDET